MDIMFEFTEILTG